MSTKKVWDATRSLAELWRESETIQQLRTQLPENNSSVEGIPEMLRNIDASTSLVSTEPLLPNKWGPMGAALPLVNLQTPGAADFLTKMQAVGFAAECNTAWLRSRLRGYPLIPVPQLAANTHLTSPEVSPGLGWRREALQGGLQFDSTPRGVSQLLALRQQDHDRAARELADALTTAPEWLAFSELFSTLTEGDRQQLAHARQRLKPLISAEAVDRHDPERMMRRYHYRRDRVMEVVSQLDGQAAEFTRSFDNVNSLINLASLNVLGQLVAYHGPVELTNVTDLERHGRTIRFRSTDPLRPAALVRIADPLTPDAAMITDMEMHGDETGLVVQSFGAEVLVGARSF
ncbi:hypothetical protein OIE68_16785 [Nocardia vinacea]|uniref:hypothetical protein n=1 Tax=Nocardia vinacea TaxID=96468 RepID=UPI002E10270E|nr:hypothetical protein OIE68_16785 [Nocardia vinacea]